MSEQELRSHLRMAYRCIDQLLRQNKISSAWCFTVNDERPEAKMTIGNFRAELRTLGKATGGEHGNES